MTWTLDIENIAGIRDGRATLEPGSNAVQGSNWQGKSSFLAAVEAAMGTARPLTEGAESGRVTLETDTETVAVDLHRTDDGITRDGDPFLPDERTRTAAALFAFLGEDNAVRAAVRADENLESVLMRPLELEDIDARIADLVAERDAVDAELSEAEDAAAELSSVDARIDELEAEIEDLEATRAELLESADGADVSEEREALSRALAEREEVTARVDRLERSVERTRETLADRRAALDDLDTPETAADLEDDLADARERHDRARRDAELLQSVYAPTKRLLDEGRLDLITAVDRDLDGDAVACWTCGADATREEIEAHLDRLRDRVTDRREQADAAAETVDELEAALESRRALQREREDLEAEIADRTSQLAERETSLERARDRLDDLEAEIDERSRTVETADDRLTDVESDLKYARAQLADRRAEREELAAAADRAEPLEDERATLTEEIADLRTRKERLKRETREAFESAMSELLDRFETGFETARLTPNFELVVAREGREASLSALSDGEVELIGIVAALAGYDAYEVGADVPVMLLDDLGGLAEANHRHLVQALRSRADRLVYTAYPEYDEADAHTISPDEWTVVSRELNH